MAIFPGFSKNGPGTEYPNRKKYYLIETAIPVIMKKKQEKLLLTIGKARK